MRSTECRSSFSNKTTHAAVVLVLVSVVSICGVSVCQHEHFWTVWDVIRKYLWEQDIVNSSDEFEIVCIPTNWRTGGGSDELWGTGGGLTSLMF